jgi:hypothetical protein
LVSHRWRKINNLIKLKSLKITRRDKIMTIATMLRTAPGKTAIAVSLALGISISLQTPAYAGAREQAYRIYSRLTGTPPSNAMLATMTECISNGSSSLSTTCQNKLSASAVSNITGDPHNVGSQGQLAAAFLAMQDPNNPNFLNIKVKNMVMPWTNKEQTVFAPLNDSAATLIGLIRDGDDFRKALYANVIYYDPDPGNNLPASAKFKPFVNINGGSGPSDNKHYEYLEHHHLDLRSVLQSATQTSVTGIPQEAVAGVLTTRATARAFFYAGTNRAMFRFTMLNYLCNDLEQIKDVTRAPDRVRQDPSRSPGGDSSIFLNNCVGCHAGMMGAFAYYNWGPAVYDPNETSQQTESESISYQQTATLNYSLSGKEFKNERVVPKFLQNFTSFPYGYVTTDDSWINYWRVGPNAKLGWGWGDGSGNSPPQPVSYNPPKSNPYPSEAGNTSMGSAAQLGYELANTHAFARCQALKVYRHVCFNDPSETTLENITTDFKSSKFNMLTVFSEAAADCSGN